MENSIRLNTGAGMPVLGLGLYNTTEAEEVQHTITTAAEIGYRMFDTASSYKNEDTVGKGLRATGLPRNELFVTTKIWNNAQRVGNIEGSLSRSLERLGLDYVDLYLIHWPVPGCSLDTWKVLEELYLKGKAKAIGVSNFTEMDLDEILEHGHIVPAVNQIEYHPLWNRDALRRFCQSNGIAVQAYAPLARGAYMDNELIKPIAEKYHRSSAQVGLRWLIQKGCSVIPKSVRDERILENSRIFDFNLDESEMDALDSLNENFRCASIPEDLLL